MSDSNGAARVVPSTVVHPEDLNLSSDIEIPASASDPGLNSGKRKMNSQGKSNNLSPIPKRSQLDSLYSATMPRSPIQTSAGVSTQNRFSVLNQASTSKSNTSTVLPNNIQKKNRIPPIVTLDISLNVIVKMMSDLHINKKNYLIKYMSIGTKISLDNNNNFQIVKDYLKAIKTPFFTHDIDAEKTKKFVLSGLHDIQTSEIKLLLAEQNIKCLDVKKMNTKSDYKCLYIVYFDDKTMKLDTLQKIKSLDNIIVKWSNYIVAKNGPTQCNNCQLYGHGIKNCNLPTRCLLCGGPHNKANCTHANDDVDDFTPKCCLCNGSHQSNSSDCPHRNKYIQMRQTTSGRFKKTPINPGFNNQQHLLDNRSFPNLSLPKQSLQSTWSSTVMTSQPKPPAVTQPQRAQSPQPSTSGTHNKYNPQHSSLNNQLNTELFSIDELITISNTLIMELSKCKTRADQYNVLTKLAFQFVYGVNNGP